jgi:Helix-turn-helix domain
MWITVSQVARIREESERTVRRRAARGELPCIRTEAGVRLFDRAEMERLAATRKAHRAAVQQAEWDLAP